MEKLDRGQRGKCLNVDGGDMGVLEVQRAKESQIRELVVDAVAGG